MPSALIGSLKQMNGVTRFAKIMLFLSSYFPLFAALAIRNIPHDGYYNWWPTIIFSTITVAALIITSIFLAIARSFATVPLTVNSCKSNQGQVISYLFTYILPFLNVTYESIPDIAAIILVYLVFAVLYINSNMIYINPFLSVIGFRIYEVVDDQDVKHVLISRRSNIESGTELEVAQLTGNVIIE